ncbi:MAG: tRNA preQ1(34) S-adenosylmethionine ribosyltransferase-isomerase QueA [Clostridiales bacterium]|nr:tRNA preQ1(34) S-adenosylmethionine ribosyltransferase-isomerase QueA [Clostridiales bacterium]
MQYKKSDFYYDLPEELIAQTPADPRDSSRLLVYNRATREVEHKIFRDITNYLRAGDVLVVNNTKVLPARLFATTRNGGAVEVLLLKRHDIDKWEVLVKPGRKCTVGKELKISDELSLVVEDITLTGERIVKFIYDGIFEEILEKLGTMPLPPYIKTQLKDKNRYQTVYAKHEGSAAAPTAGLHFTPELLEKIRGMGVEIAEVLLHVGLGTFRPVKEDIITDHKMHSEHYEISAEAAATVNAAKREGRRVIAVGTTSVRTLESASDSNGYIKACKDDTQIFIYPTYKFKCVDALVTNFHLPESTLIMLVAALTGREEVLSLYETAVKEQYRFFSFGDATLIL